MASTTANTSSQKLGPITVLTGLDGPPKRFGSACATRNSASMAKHPSSNAVAAIAPPAAYRAAGRHSATPPAAASSSATNTSGIPHIGVSPTIALISCWTGPAMPACWIMPQALTTKSLSGPSEPGPTLTR